MPNVTTALASFAVFAVVVSNVHGAIASADRALAVRNVDSLKTNEDDAFDFEGEAATGQGSSTGSTVAETETEMVLLPTPAPTGSTASDQGECTASAYVSLNV